MKPNRQSGLLFIMTGIQTPESTPMEFSWSNALKNCLLCCQGLALAKVELSYW
jgi:hypothetical protein